MPHLGVFAPTMSAGGVERFVHGVVGTLVTAEVGADWRVTVFQAPTETAGNPALPWPAHLRSPRLELVALPEPATAAALRVGAAVALGLEGGRLGPAVRSLVRATRRLRVLAEHRSLARTTRWMSEECTRRGIDVAFFPDPFRIPFPDLSVPVVATTHDFNFWRFPSDDRVLQARAERRMHDWLARSDAAVVSSDFIRDEALAFDPGCGDRLHLVRLGIPTASGPAGRDGTTTTPRLPDATGFVLNVGWIAPHKNQIVLARAMASLRAAGHTVPLVLVGPNAGRLLTGHGPAATPYVASVREELDRAGLVPGRDLHVLSRVSDAALHSLYGAAGVLVMPTRYEAGSFPVREAMALGVPVAMADIPVLREENDLLDGAGWLFPPDDPEALADTIATVLAGGDDVARRVRTGRKLAPQVFDWNQTARGYLSLFRKACRR